MHTAADRFAEAYQNCMLCPRRCHAKRASGQRGRCGATAELRIARAAPHLWEEPPISGTNGSGAIFFVGCPLGCIYCQNAPLSIGSTVPTIGKPVSTERLATIMCELEGIGCHNINLVTPLHFAPQIRCASILARKAGLTAPIIVNTSGYETAETIRALSDVVDIWLTDYKYADASLAQRYSRAGEYPQVAHDALDEMLRALKRRGGRAVDSDGLMKRGVIVRHLLLPGAIANACDVLDSIWELAGTEQADVSIMNQYTPNAAMHKLDEPLGRGVSETEYERVLSYADDLDFEHVWWQRGGTVSESFIPAWDCIGVDGPIDARMYAK